MWVRDCTWCMGAYSMNWAQIETNFIDVNKICEIKKKETEGGQMCMCVVYVWLVLIIKVLLYNQHRKRSWHRHIGWSHKINNNNNLNHVHIAAIFYLRHGFSMGYTTWITIALVPHTQTLMAHRNFSIQFEVNLNGGERNVARANKWVQTNR